MSDQLYSRSLGAGLAYRSLPPVLVRYWCGRLSLPTVLAREPALYRALSKRRLLLLGVLWVTISFIVFFAELTVVYM